ncbi:MAG: hypothetical protein DMD41_16250 [Gemmatimonadetes bacterium]|nr:MAG: hypothetical protein DMD41_16250 [Gemmatimonadota bacterium]
MFEFEESVSIDAPVSDVWKFVTDVSRWWLPRAPTTLLQLRTAKGLLGLGDEVGFEEWVGGNRGEARGTITEWTQGRAVTWEGEATYRYFGVRIRIEESVTWRVQPRSGGSELSARVWARFPPGLLGRLTEWYAEAVLHIVDKDRQHARRELDYLKRALESAAPARGGVA